ncbi:hypothetical protein F0562_004190 [Nyssa sinensis]|uniref:Uncharacterized protein n=1 Tax=Nyssa sinensis TaxID=561372 RepID=A0A5J5C2N1_9ASTE|nr:hypothetical protein F0562_004190 [Nyssa sinensis]
MGYRSIHYKPHEKVNGLGGLHFRTNEHLPRHQSQLSSSPSDFQPLHSLGLEGTLKKKPFSALRSHRQPFASSEKMIKRRLYKQEHGDGDGASDSSSSSSDSELEAEAAEETESEDDVVAEVRENSESCSTSSGYESEDSSANEVHVDSSDLLTNDDDAGNGNDGQNAVKNWILKCKSVFKCRLCPRIVCLTEETLKAHLKSKRHGRSEKLLSEGRLKLMLNSDGEIEGETHAERHASTLASAQNTADSKKKNKGRQRQRKRLKKKTGEDLNLEKAGQSTKNPAKKRRKSEN